MEIIFEGRTVTPALLIKEKDSLGNELEGLISTDYEAAKSFAAALCSPEFSGSLTRAEASACAALVCRFLLCKKNKSRLVPLLTGEDDFRRAVFGTLNTNKYSLIFLFKRLLRQNDPALTLETLVLLKGNPFREKKAEPWSDRWCLDFIIEESLSAPEDYLCLTKENEEAVKGFLEKIGDQ